MGWCYTFGIRCGAGCNDPMLVREYSKSCACESCGATCTGKFSNCREIVFRPGGLDFQLRCLPEQVLDALSRRRSGASATAVAGAHGGTGLPQVPGPPAPPPSDSGAAAPSAHHDLSPESPVGSPPHLRSRETEARVSAGETPPQRSSLAEIRSGMARLLESTAAVHLAVAKLEAELASLRAELTELKRAVVAEPPSAHASRRPRAV